MKLFGIFVRIILLISLNQYYVKVVNQIINFIKFVFKNLYIDYLIGKQTIKVYVYTILK